MMTPPKILIIDIETTPNLADVWGLWQQNVALSQLRASTQLLCFAWKWHGSKVTNFVRDDAVQIAWDLLDQADIIVHFNGKRFDIPHLNREFLQANLAPPSPYKQVDLCEVVKKTFRFPSNKLAYVAPTLGLTPKEETGGHDLWVRCMAGDVNAWVDMARYNIQDVDTTEELYDRLLPWISGHPHLGLFVDDARPICGRCGGTRLQRRGVASTSVSLFQRYQCQSCGGWSRGNRRVNSVGVRDISP